MTMSENPYRRGTNDLNSHSHGLEKTKTEVHPDYKSLKRQSSLLQRLCLVIMGLSLIFKAVTFAIGFFSQTNALAISANSSSAPTVTVKNGTLVGEHNAFYNQDFFKGIPYAQPPVGDLRFRVPVPLNSSWNGTKTATEFSPECVGYGVSLILPRYMNLDIDFEKE